MRGRVRTRQRAIRRCGRACLDSRPPAPGRRRGGAWKLREHPGENVRGEQIDARVGGCGLRAVLRSRTRATDALQEGPEPHPWSEKSITAPDAPQAGSGAVREDVAAGTSRIESADDDEAAVGHPPRGAARTIGL